MALTEEWVRAVCPTGHAEIRYRHITTTCTIYSCGKPMTVVEKSNVPLKIVRSGRAFAYEYDGSKRRDQEQP